MTELINIKNLVVNKLIRSSATYQPFCKVVDYNFFVVHQVTILQNLFNISFVKIIASSFTVSLHGSDEIVNIHFWSCLFIPCVICVTTSWTDFKGLTYFFKSVIFFGSARNQWAQCVLVECTCWIRINVSDHLQNFLLWWIHIKTSNYSSKICCRHITISVFIEKCEDFTDLSDHDIGKNFSLVWWTRFTLHFLF